MFSGSLITANQCPGWSGDVTLSGLSVPPPPTSPLIPSFITQTFPDLVRTFPSPLLLRGPIGFSLRSGEILFNSLDDGLSGVSGPPACTNGVNGVCESGTDIALCTLLLEKQCGSGQVANVLLSHCDCVDQIIITCINTLSVTIIHLQPTLTNIPL
jgi:hypothetical protein